MTVEASADASAEGLAKPFAGGQVAKGGRVGLLGGIKKLSLDIGSFRSSVGLYNWAAAPRQTIVQHTGNVFALLLTKPSAMAAAAIAGSSAASLLVMSWRCCRTSGDPGL